MTLPSKIVHAIDREELNRSRFVLKAVTHELDRRRAVQLRQPLSHPHPESLEMADVGFTNWAEALPDDAADLIAPGAGEEVRWTAGRGWVGTDECNPGGESSSCSPGAQPLVELALPVEALGSDACHARLVSLGAERSVVVASTKVGRANGKDYR